MKKTFRILCGFVCMLTLVALVLSSCNSGGASQNTTPTDVTTENNSPTVITPEETTAPSEDTEPTKQVPVYQGMSISTSLGKPMVSFARRGVAPVKYEKQGNTENNGNHYGWYKGDSADEKGDVDQNTPFPDADENIEQEIKDSLKVVGSGQEIYYATQNQDIYIHIHIHNPDQFEILSFTLNGQKYSSYMFEAGSTQELLILKLNVGNASGIVDYTIDQIKYIDGTEIKDVMIDGNKTVKVGVRTENQVSANVSDLQIGTNSVSFNATIADKDDLIAFSNGVIKAVLYDGSVLLSEKELAIGTNEVVFEGLKNGTVYQYAIVACYDNLTGDAIDFHLLTKEAFQTNNIVLFDNIVVGQDSINFTFKWDESVTNKALNSLKLYKNGELVTTLEANATTATDLFSASEYVLVAEYQDLGQPATISLTFATLEKGVPGISIINPTQTQTSVGFEIVETDADNVGAITKIELVHENGTVVADNIDVRNFANLLSNTAYTVKVTYTYDLNDGNGAQTINKEKEIVTFAKAVPEISIINPAQTQTSVGFEIVETDADNVGAITKIELVHANGTVSATSLDQRTFADLLSNNEYTIKVTYVYNLNDGVGDKIVTKEATVKTDAKATPEISILNPTQTQTSVGFEIVEIDVDNVGEITKIELVHANGIVSATSLNQRTFADLLSNNAYTVKLTYVYNLNDGTGNTTVVKELAITTIAKNAPSFEVKNENVTTDSISAEYDVTDVDNILASYKVELYQGTTLVLENTEKAISFASLNYYTDYTLKISYTYNLNDGKGEQASVFEKSYKTLPFIDVLECNVANTSAVSEGETIFMSVKLNNPLGMTVESVVINGETYGVTGASTKNKIFVEIVYNGQFAGGDTYLKVEKVNAKLESTTLTIEPQTELSDNVFINGKLEVLKIDFVNEDFEPIDWAFPSDTVYVMIALNNPTGYNIDCVNGNITDLIKLDDNYWYYDATDYLHNGWCGSTLDSLGYSNNHISKIVSYSDMHIWCYLTTTNETIYIRNANDLKNMSSGCYYELANDIDLNGIEWDGECFEGVFDGKGYAIKNISFVGNIKNSNAYLGLFDSGSGVIQNLNIEEATIIADVTTSDEGEYVLYCGGLIAYSTLTKINNCKIDETSVINIKTNSGTSYVGSLIGYVAPANDVFLSNCINSCSISLKSNNRQASIYAGGLIGGVNNTGYVLYSNYLINIINCLNSGDISAYYEDVEGYQCGAGALIGIAGMLNDSSKLIVNSFGSLNTGNTNYRFIGVSNYDHSVFIDTYSLLSIDQGMLCTIEQLNSKHFYTEILGWSADVWDFSELDVANGKYPKLK